MRTVRHLLHRKTNKRARLDRLRARTLGLALAGIAVLSGLPPAFAQRIDPRPGFNHIMDQLFADAAGSKRYAEKIHILSQYCKPPDEPNKEAPQFEIDLERLVLKQLLRDLSIVQNNFTAAEKARLGVDFRASFPKIDGLDPTDEAHYQRYWNAARARLLEVEAVLNKKREQLNKAKLVDCRRQETKQQAPPPKPPPDPLTGLKRPTPRQITFAEIPSYFCSTLERRGWYLQNFASEWLEAADNAADASHYLAQVAERGAEHFIKDGDKAQQKILDNEERWANKNSMHHLRIRDLADQTQAKIFSTPIIDCSSRSVAALVEQQRGQVVDIDAEVKTAENKIKAIDESIKDVLIENDLIDAYEHGVLWGVPPTTVEHHNILRYVSEAQGEQSSLKQKIAKLQKRKSELQNQLNSTIKFADELNKAGDPCPEEPKTATVNVTATPSAQKVAPAAPRMQTPQAPTAQTQAPSWPASPLTPEQLKQLNARGREWGMADLEAEQIRDQLPPRDLLQYRLQSRLDTVLRNHPISDQEKKAFADGYWSAYEDLADRRTTMTQVEPQTVQLSTGATPSATSTPSRTIITDPLWHLRRLADAWVNSGNPYLKRQGESLSAQLDEIEKSRRGAGAQTTQSSSSAPISSSIRFRIEGQIKDISWLGQGRAVLLTALNTPFSWDADDAEAPAEAKIDANGIFNVESLLIGPPWPMGLPDQAQTVGTAGAPAATGTTRSTQNRIELELGDDRWKIPLAARLRNVVLARGPQGDPTIYGWNSEEAAAHGCRAGPGRSFVTPANSAYSKLNIAAFSLQRLSASCREFLNGLGPVYSESNYRRNVAPAPSLDPAYWPDAKPELLSVSFSAREKKAGAFDSEIPALIPSIGVGIGGRADREDREQDFPHELPR